MTLEEKIEKIIGDNNNKLLDAVNGVTSPALGELIDETKQELLKLIKDLIQECKPKPEVECVCGEYGVEDELYNLDIWTMQKVNDAFTRAFIGKRNDLCLGRLFTKEDGTTARTYDATYQTQAAIATGSTYDENLYLTILDAYKKLRALKDYQTGQEIDATRAVIVTTYADAWDIQRVIRGQINDNKGKPINLEPMSYITEIWPYRGDVIKANGITTTYAGCASKTAYLIVPGTSQSPAYTMVKRGLTYETGSGNVLTLSREQRVAYFGQCNYLDEFFGGSADTALTAGTGYCVKMTLPSA